MRFVGIILGVGLLASFLPAVSYSNDFERLEQAGKALFFTAELSRDGLMSCATCHVPSQLYSDGYERALSRTREMTRNTPSILALNGYTSFFWDGRASSLPEQIKGPLFGRQELFSDSTRIKRFLISKGFASEDTSSVEAVNFSVKAIESYINSISTKETVYWKYLDESYDLSDIETKGLKLFNDWGCSTCHSGRYLTDNQYHDVGSPRRKIVLQSRQEQGGQITYELGYDYGRGNIESGVDNLYKFRTPSLINVEKTAPYMHDGAFRDLEEAVVFYARRRNGDVAQADVDALLSFLGTLTDARYGTAR